MRKQIKVEFDGGDCMNELYIGSLVMYFKTNKTTYDEAYAELEAACDKVGIELCGGRNGELRNENGEAID